MDKSKLLRELEEWSRRSWHILFFRQQIDISKTVVTGLSKYFWKMDERDCHLESAGPPSLEREDSMSHLLISFAKLHLIDPPRSNYLQ